MTDENGTLEANVVAEGTDELIFTNTADLTVSAADALQITKNLHASAETAGLVNAEAGRLPVHHQGPSPPRATTSPPPPTRPPSWA